MKLVLVGGIKRRAYKCQDWKIDKAGQ